MKSTKEKGNRMITITKRFRFDAAHFLPYYKGDCQRLHGHGYVLEVEVGGMIDFLITGEEGMIIDFSKLKEIVNTNIIDKFDHHLLNDYVDNPTAEELVYVFVKILQDKLPKRTELKSVRLYETKDSWAQWSTR